jgi:hypothetical protein
MNCSITLRSLDREEITEREAHACLIASGADPAEADEILAIHAGADDVVIL